jgi:hypothetical protein
LTRNGSPDITKRDMPFGFKYVVTLVVTWSGGSHLVHVRVGEHRKGPVVLYVLKVPVGTKEPFWLRGI